MKFVQVRQNDQDPSLLEGFPLYWVNKGSKDSKENFRRPKSPDNMGELDKDLCLFWKRVAVPSLIRALTKSMSKSTPGVKVNTRRYLDEETPSASVAKAWRRQEEASPRQGVA